MQSSKARAAGIASDMRYFGLFSQTTADGVLSVGTNRYWKKVCSTKMSDWSVSEAAGPVLFGKHI